MERIVGDEGDPLTRQVIGAAIEVHREMGPGLLESVYQKCLEKELTRQGLSFVPQARLPLMYKGEDLLHEFVIDVFFPSKLVIELKSIEKLLPIHEAQLLTYPRLSLTRVGLLINFNVHLLKDGIKRMVL
jgi:GxxExxY protein